MRSFLPFPLLPKAGLLILKLFLTHDCLACSEKFKWWRLHNSPGQAIPVLNCPDHYPHVICGGHTSWHSFLTKRKGLFENTESLISVGSFSCDVKDGSFPAHSALWQRLCAWRKVNHHFQSCLWAWALGSASLPALWGQSRGASSVPCSPTNFV